MSTLFRKLPPFLALDGEPASGSSTAVVEPPTSATPATPATPPAAPAPATPAAPAPAPGSTPATPAPPVPAPPAGAQPATPAAPAAPTPALTAEQIAELPEWAQREIRETRRENQNLRGTRTEAENQAAKDAENRIAQTIGKALGLVPDETPADPAALATQVAEAQTAAREARVELAVFRSAPSTATATLLLDSRSFMTKVAGLDPSNASFDAQVATAIAEEVALQPTRFSAPAAPAAPASTGGAPITGAPSDAPDSIDALRDSYRTRQSPGS
jgi:hypothetical protein